MVFSLFCVFLQTPKENKVNLFSKPFIPTDDIDADFKFMRSFFEGIIGKIPEYS